KRFVKGFPVKPFFDTLFVVYSKQGSFTAEERAAAIAGRIQKLANDLRFRGDSILLLPSETTIDLVYRDNMIMSLSDEDALWINSNRNALAKAYKLKIGKAVANYHNETSLKTLAKEIGLAALVIAVLTLVIMVINRVFRRLSRKVATWEGTLLKGIHIRNYELFNSRREVAFIHNVLNVVKWLLIVLAIYLALPVLFGIFPWTRDFSETLIGYVTSPLKKILYAIWDYLPNFFTILVLIIVFRYIIRFFHFLKTEIERGALRLPGFYADWANPTFQIIRVLILAFMLIVIFPYMPGSDSPIFKGVSVFVGVLFTFGSAGALGNVVAGLVLTYMRAFHIGDRVKIGEVTGDIIERSLLVTRIRTIKNEIISVPNSTVMSSHTVNFSSDAGTKGLIIHTTVTIGYDIDWRRVYELLKQAAAKTELLEKEPDPFVLQISLNDYYVSYQLNAYTKYPNKQAVIYSNLFENIQDTFHEAGIEIMSPHFYALRDGHKVNIPENKYPPQTGDQGIRVRMDPKE
ncbi:MAG: mechanosensitive ion channel family protein, partial [Sphingobacteriaceae bacterium]